MDRIDARVNPETMDEWAMRRRRRLTAWGVARTSLGDIFRVPRLDRRGVAALVGLIILAWLSTSLYRVQPDEKGVVLRFGEWVETTDPGLHVHLPYPIETVLLPKVTQVNQMQLGVGALTATAEGQSEPRPADADGRREHRRGRLHRVLEDPRPGQFLFKVDNPELAVRIAAEGALRDVISRTPIQAAMSDKRQQIADETHALLQKLLDDEHAGVEITQVQLQRVEPPLAVIDAFNDVQRARADQERARNEAEAYANDILPRARGDARAHSPGGGSLQGAGRQSRRGRSRRLPADLEELRGGEGRDRPASLSRKRRRGAEEGLEGHRRHVRQGRIERHALYAGDRIQAVRRGRSALRRRSLQRRGRRNEKPLAGRNRSFVALALDLIISSIYVISEGEQALVVRLGAPVGVVDKPGLKFKAPFIDTVYVTSARSLLLEPPVEQAIMGDQKRLEVQPYARYRIVDPLRFYQALRTSDAANAQLAQLVSSSARRALGQAPLRALLTDERGHILDVIKGEVAAKAEPLGVSVDEVRFHRADLPFETSQAIYDRMKSERQREAKELRAQGFEWAQQIQARADRDRTVILSEAQRAAAIARGEGDAEANRTLADAFSQEPAVLLAVSIAADLQRRARQFRPDNGREPGRGLHAAFEVGSAGVGGDNGRPQALRSTATRAASGAPPIDGLGSSKSAPTDGRT